MLVKTSHWRLVLGELLCSKKRKSATGFWLVFLWLMSVYAVMHLTDRSFNRLDAEVLDKLIGRGKGEPADFLCPPRITVALDMDRLGNKFFEYLAAREMAEVMDSVVYLTPSFGRVYDKYFVGRKTPVVEWNIFQHRCGLTQSQFVTLNINYLPDLKPPANYTPYNQILGYPMNITSTTWEAIFARRHQVMKEFQWKPDLKASTEKKLTEIRSSRNTSTVVSVHVRRTDYYIYVASFYESFHSADTSYFKNAMDYFRNKYSKPVFLIFSDDMKWCRENLIAPDILYTGDGNENDPGSDLAVMSLSDHIILSYGTFGMMAAYFSDGEIVAADNFTGKPEAMVENLKMAPSVNWKWMSV